jgi:hypothetical protein
MGFSATASELKDWLFDENTSSGWIDPNDFARGRVHAWNALHPPHKYILPSDETHINFWESCIGPYTFTESPKALRTLIAPRLITRCSSGKAYPAMWRTLETLVANAAVLESIVPPGIVTIRDKGTSPLTIHIGLDSDFQTDFECLVSLGVITHRVVVCSVEAMHPRARSALRRTIQRQCPRARVDFATHSNVCDYFHTTV